MGYYSYGMRGDYYRGARGDPGFLSSLGGVMSSLGGLIPGVGPLISGAGKLLGGVKKAAPVAKAATEGANAEKGIVKTAVGAIQAHPVLTAAGAAGVLGAAAGAGTTALLSAPGGCPKGYHISRSKHAKHFGACVRNRRMRVTNPKALRRAIRRTHGFAKLAMRTIHLVHPKKHARFGGFKKRARKR
jgi:hypothetical protein